MWFCNQTVSYNLFRSRVLRFAIRGSCERLVDLHSWSFGYCYFFVLSFILLSIFVFVVVRAILMPGIHLSPNIFAFIRDFLYLLFIWFYTFFSNRSTTSSFIPHNHSCIALVNPLVEKWSLFSNFEGLWKRHFCQCFLHNIYTPTHSYGEFIPRMILPGRSCVWRGGRRAGGVCLPVIREASEAAHCIEQRHDNAMLFGPRCWGGGGRSHGNLRRWSTMQLMVFRRRVWHRKGAWFHSHSLGQ